MPSKIGKVRGREIVLNWQSSNGKLVFTAIDKKTGIRSFQKFSKQDAINSLFERLESAGKEAAELTQGSVR
ncbi:MAG: hypothetical protein AB1656_04955 [Candidatus Omnitrophota bacterium]